MTRLIMEMTLKRMPPTTSDAKRNTSTTPTAATAMIAAGCANAKTHTMNTPVPAKDRLVTNSSHSTASCCQYTSVSWYVKARGAANPSTGVAPAKSAPTRASNRPAAR